MEPKDVALRISSAPFIPGMTRSVNRRSSSCPARIPRASWPLADVKTSYPPRRRAVVR